jgi:hypothetical protein
MDVAERLGLVDEGNLFDILAMIIIAVPYILSSGLSLFAIFAGVAILPIVPAFLTFPAGPGIVLFIYGAAGMGVLYYYVLVYYIRKHWDSVFAQAWEIISKEISDQLGFLIAHIKYFFVCASDSTCREDYLKNNSSYMIRMLIYGPLVASVLFSLNYDAFFILGTSRNPSEEIEYSKVVMDLGL